MEKDKKTCTTGRLHIQSKLILPISKQASSLSLLSCYISGQQQFYQFLFGVHSAVQRSWQIICGISLKQQVPSFFFMYPLQYMNLNTASVSPLPTYSPSCRPVSFHFPNHSCKLFTHRDIALVTFVRPLRGPALFSQPNTSIQKIFL